jgi:hypothetical protein
MTPTITAFANSPDKGRGLARDMQVRWARRSGIALRCEADFIYAPASCARKSALSRSPSTRPYA